jgi:ankyrin repeat protein
VKIFSHKLYEKNSLGMTALNEALVRAITVEEVERLIKEGADIDAKDSDGQTALVFASKKGHSVIVELLLKHDADINAKDSGGGTALMWASVNSHIAITQILLEAGSDINARNDYGNKAIHFARTVEMAQVLIANYADPEAIGRDDQTLMQRLQINPEANSELIIFLRDQCGIP